MANDLLPLPSRTHEYSNSNGATGHKILLFNANDTITFIIIVAIQLGQHVIKGPRTPGTTSLRLKPKSSCSTAGHDKVIARGYFAAQTGRAGYFAF